MGGKVEPQTDQEFSPRIALGQSKELCFFLNEASSSRLSAAAAAAKGGITQPALSWFQNSSNL